VHSPAKAAAGLKSSGNRILQRSKLNGVK